MEGYIGQYNGAQVEFANSADGDVIIHTFSDSIERAAQIHSGLVKAFPEHQVITVPDTTAIGFFDKRSTIEFLQGMIHYLEEL